MQVTPPGPPSAKATWLSLNSLLFWFMTVTFPRICLQITRSFIITVTYLIWGRRPCGILLSHFHYWPGSSSFWEDYCHCGQSWTRIKLGVEIMECTSILGSHQPPHLRRKLWSSWAGLVIRTCVNNWSNLFDCWGVQGRKKKKSMLYFEKQIYNTMVYFEQNVKTDMLWGFCPEKRNMKIQFEK